jgi:hypothetical protein
MVLAQGKDPMGTTEMIDTAVSWACNLQGQMQCLR